MNKAMVWGAGGGIGRAVVNRLTAQGWTVVAVTRHTDGTDLQATHIVEADVTSPFEVETAVTSAAQLIDDLNLWVYAVGDIAAARSAEMSLDTWHRLLSANLTGAFLTAHHSLPLLAKDAHMMFVGAISERLRLPGLSAYAAAKAGLEAFAETLGKEQRPRRVTVVRPGAVNTPLWEKVPLRLPATAIEPQTVAEKIIEAYGQGHTGLLDIV